MCRYLTAVTIHVANIAASLYDVHFGSVHMCAAHQVHFHAISSTSVTLHKQIHLTATFNNELAVLQKYTKFLFIA